MNIASQPANQAGARSESVLGSGHELGVYSCGLMFEVCFVVTVDGQGRPWLCCAGQRLRPR